MRPLNHSGARISARSLGAGSVVALSLLAAQPPAAYPLGVATAATPLPAVVIRGAWVFDGEQLLAAADVLVEGGRIRRIGHGLSVGPGAEEVDARGDTLLPGLIDSHTHDWGDSAKQALLFGVTTELNMGARPDFVAELKRAEAAGKASDSAHVLSAGNVVTPPKGHGTEYGFPVPTLTSPSEAQGFVDARLAEGSDYIKIILEGGQVCHLEFAELSREELAAAIAAAHKRGRMAIVHISSQGDARIAIFAGADGIAHLFADAPPQPDFIALMRRRHAFAITTLGAIGAALGTPSGAALTEDPRLAPFLTTDAQLHMREAVPFRCTGDVANAFAAARELRAAGVPVLVGTDSPAPGSWNGASVHGELKLLVEAGFSPTEALAAATSVPARLFHLNDRGRIAAGRRADLLLVRGEPTREITATRDIIAIWKDGVPVHRSVAIPSQRGSSP